MPHPSQKEEFYTLKKDISIDAFQDVHIDDKSLEILETAKKILNDDKHELHDFLPYKKEIRFVVIFYYHKEQTCFHARFAIGLHAGVKNKIVEKHKKYFGKTRVCKARKNAPGVVHKELMKYVEQEENFEKNYIIKNLSSSDDYNLDILGSSFKLYSSGKIEALNRSGQNENLFKANELALMSLMYPTDDIRPIRDQMLFKIGRKMTYADLLELKNGKITFISKKNNDFVVYFLAKNNKVKELLIQESDSLYHSLSFAYSAYSNFLQDIDSIMCNTLLSKLPQVLENKLSDENFAELYTSIWNLVRNNGYQGSAVPYMGNFDTWSFTNGPRNMPKFYFSKLMKSLLTCLNKTFQNKKNQNSDSNNFNNEGKQNIGDGDNFSYSCQTEDINALEKIWLEKARTSDVLMQNLLICALIKTSAYDIETWNNQRPYEEDFSKTLGLLSELNVNIYKKRCPENIALLNHLMLNRQDINITFKDKNTLCINPNGLFKKSTLKNKFPIEIKKSNCSNPFLNNIFNTFLENKNDSISAEKAPEDFFQFLIEQMNFNDGNEFDKHPLWVTFYIKSLTNNNFILADALEKQLMKDISKKNKTINTLIADIIMKNIAHAQSTNDHLLFQNLRNLAKHALENGLDSKKLETFMEEKSNQTMKDGFIEFLFFNNSKNIDNLLVKNNMHLLEFEDIVSMRDREFLKIFNEKNPRKLQNTIYKKFTKNDQNMLFDIAAPHIFSLLNVDLDSNFKKFYESLLDEHKSRFIKNILPILSEDIKIACSICHKAPEHKSIIIGAIEKKLPHTVETADQFDRVCELFDKNKKNVFLDKIEKKLHSLVKTSEDFNLIAKHLKGKYLELFIEKIVSEKFEIFNNKESFLFLHSCLIKKQNDLGIMLPQNMQTSEMLMQNLLIQNLTKRLNCNTKNKNEKNQYGKEFSNIFALLDELNAPIYEKYYPKNISILNSLMLNREDINMSFKDKNTLCINSSDLFKNSTLKNKFSIEIKKSNCTNPFLNKIFNGFGGNKNDSISAGKAPEDFFQFLIEHMNFKDENKFDKHPLWLMFYKKALINNNLILADALEKQLMKDVGKKNKTINALIADIIIKNISYAQSTNDYLLFKNFRNLAEHALKNGLNSKKLDTFMKEKSNQTMKDGFVEFLFINNRENTGNLLLKEHCLLELKDIVSKRDNEFLKIFNETNSTQIKNIICEQFPEKDRAFLFTIAGQHIFTLLNSNNLFFSFTMFYNTLKSLKTSDFDYPLIFIKSILPILSEDIDAACFICRRAPEHKDIIIDAIERKLPKTVKTAEQFDRLYKLFDKNKKNMLLDKMEKELPSLVKTSEDFNLIIKHLEGKSLDLFVGTIISEKFEILKSNNFLLLLLNKSPKSKEFEIYHNIKIPELKQYFNGLLYTRKHFEQYFLKPQGDFNHLLASIKNSNEFLYLYKRINGNYKKTFIKKSLLKIFDLFKKETDFIELYKTLDKEEKAILCEGMENHGKEFNSNFLTGIYPSFSDEDKGYVFKKLSASLYKDLKGKENIKSATEDMYFFIPPYNIFIPKHQTEFIGNLLELMIKKSKNSDELCLSFKEIYCMSSLKDKKMILNKSKELIFSSIKNKKNTYKDLKSIHDMLINEDKNIWIAHIKNHYGVENSQSIDFESIGKLEKTLHHSMKNKFHNSPSLFSEKKENDSHNDESESESDPDIQNNKQNTTIGI